MPRVRTSLTYLKERNRETLAVHHDGLDIPGDGDAGWDLHVPVEHVQKRTELGVLDHQERLVVTCAPQREKVSELRI